LSTWRWANGTSPPKAAPPFKTLKISPNAINGNALNLRAYMPERQKRLFVRVIRPNERPNAERSIFLKS
jgi:hypothetical protein